MTEEQAFWGAEIRFVIFWSTENIFFDKTSTIIDFTYKLHSIMLETDENDTFETISTQKDNNMV